MADDCSNASSAFGTPWKESLLECCQEVRNGTFSETGDASNEAPSSSSSSSSSQTSSNNRCPDGFEYNARLNQCDDIDECAESADDCDPEYETCRNTVGDYICEDLPGVVLDGHHELCSPGFRFYLTSCIDVDECFEETDSCDDGDDGDEACVNTEGSFECVERRRDSDGGVVWVRCPRGYEQTDDGECADINECNTGSNNCLESQRCDNTIGSFACVRYMTCGTGYTLNRDSGECEDTDECALGHHNCDTLGPGYHCLNMQGTFRCEKRRCNIGEILTEDGLCSVLRCQNGFEPGTSGTCVDVDECADYDHSCDVGQRCENTVGSFHCVGECELGLRMDPVTRRCGDIDECASGAAACIGNGQTCVNTIGSFRCECQRGFRQSAANPNVCEDVDECGGNGICGIDSECQNSAGSYRCVCKAGFQTKDGQCVDIDECKEIRGICQHRCTNIWGSYRCHCEPGFRQEADGRTCQDVDECAEYDGICLGHCQNEPGSYRCTCPQGYLLSSNERSCKDVDECLQNPNPCGDDPDMFCYNTRGGYRCNDVTCPAGYSKEEGHERRCRRNNVRCALDDVECRRRPVSVSYNFITLISSLRVSSSAGVNLFTMQSARYRLLTTRFTLSVKTVRAPKDVEPATRQNFRLKTGAHSAIVAIVKPIKGPQDIVLELLMEMYNMGRFQASAAANINIFVTPYDF